MIQAIAIGGAVMVQNNIEDLNTLLPLESGPL